MVIVAKPGTNTARLDADQQQMQGVQDARLAAVPA